MVKLENTCVLKLPSVCWETLNFFISKKKKNLKNNRNGCRNFAVIRCKKVFSNKIYFNGYFPSLTVNSFRWCNWTLASCSISGLARTFGITYSESFNVGHTILLTGHDMGIWYNHLLFRKEILNFCYTVCVLHCF